MRAIDTLLLMLSYVRCQDTARSLRATLDTLLGQVYFPLGQVCNMHHSSSRRPYVKLGYEL